MTDKEKITEILKAYTKKHNIMASSVILEEYAEELLANGVIVPPCKVGDMVYIVKCYTNSYLEIVSREVISTLVKEIIVNENGISIMTEEAEYTAEHIGEFVFLTKEEAEEKLKELKDNA